MESLGPLGNCKEGRSFPSLLLLLVNNFIKWILSLPYNTQSLSFFFLKDKSLFYFL